jgi:hypothetical protein
MITFRHGDTPATLTQLGNPAKAIVTLLDQSAPATTATGRFESAKKATAIYLNLKRLRFEYVATVARISCPPAVCAQANIRKQAHCGW